MGDGEKTNVGLNVGATNSGDVVKVLSVPDLGFVNDLYPSDSREPTAVVNIRSVQSRITVSKESTRR